MRLYPVVVVEGQSFVGEKIITVPKASLSLKQIIERFVRNEPLPVGFDGTYIDVGVDLEKFSNKDFTEQSERIDEIRSLAERLKQREDEQAAALSQTSAPSAVPKEGGAPS